MLNFALHSYTFKWEFNLQKWYTVGQVDKEVIKMQSSVHILLLCHFALQHEHWVKTLNWNAKIYLKFKKYTLCFMKYKMKEKDRLRHHKQNYHVPLRIMLKSSGNWVYSIINSIWIILIDLTNSMMNEWRHNHFHLKGIRSEWTELRENIIEIILKVNAVTDR